MPFLTAAVVLVGVLCLLDLALTIGVIRRLREYAAQLEASAVSLRDPIAAPGTTVDDFAAVTTDGEPVTRELLTGRTVVGFFSPTCAPCVETVPAFAAYAGDVGRDHVLAVVIGEPGAAGHHVERLAPAARVVVEPFDGPIARAFRVTGYPALAIIDADHRIVVSGVTMDHLVGAAVAA